MASVRILLGIPEVKSFRVMVLTSLLAASALPLDWELWGVVTTPRSGSRASAS